MKREEFLNKFQDILQTEETLSFNMELDSIEEWDSLSKMSTAAFLDSDFNIAVTFDDFLKMKTIEDIAIKAGI